MTFESYNFRRSSDYQIEIELNKDFVKDKKFISSDREKTILIRINLPKNMQIDIKKYEKIVYSILNHAENDLQKATSLTLEAKDSKWSLTFAKENRMTRSIKSFVKKIGLGSMINPTPPQGIVELNLISKSNKTLYSEIEIPSIPINEIQETFKDSYTQISTYAFKYLEKDFIGHDYDKPKQVVSDYVIVKKGNFITLSPKENVNKIEAQLALEEYKKHLIKNIGSEKLNYILLQAGINFKNLDQLTPEHVYRINILSCSMEIQDVESLLTKMTLAVKEMKQNEERYPVNKNLLENLNKISFLSEREIQSIVKYLKILNTDVSTENFTLVDLINSVSEIEPEFNHSLFTIKVLLNTYESTSENVTTLYEFLNSFSHLISEEEVNQSILLLEGKNRIDEFQEAFKNYFSKHPVKLHEKLSSSKFNQLIEAINPTTEEKNLAYTGKKITKPIFGKYTIADKKFYKPWIDQQELLQTYELLETDIIKDPYTGLSRLLTQEEKIKRFDEQATFILCKKNLFHAHPTEGYRVGMIFPGPSDENGNKRWYQVVSIVASNGLLNYQIQPLGKDNNLQSYILSRSTSSSSYAFQSLETIRNDFNPISSPGYLGRQFIKKGMEEIRKAHTVPEWVMYQYSAQLLLNEENPNVNKIKERLLTSAKLLEKETKEIDSQKSLHQLIRDHNSEILLLSSYGISKKNLIKRTIISKNERKKFEKNVLHFSHKYSKVDLRYENEKQKKQRIKNEKKAAEFLLSYINKYGKESDGNIDPRFNEFILELKKIVNPRAYEKNEIFNEDLTKLLDDLKNEKNPSLNLLKSVENQLKTIAIEKNENVESKKTNGIRLAGHSLGGSTAQVEAYTITAGSRRIPVPNTTLNVALYDDPGCNEEDNADMYGFMSQHYDVMKELNSSVNIYHSHEIGDIVPMGGTAHLGSLNPATERKLWREIKNVILSNPTLWNELKEELKKIVPTIEHSNIDKLNYDEIKNNPLILSKYNQEFIKIFTSKLKVTSELKSATKNALEPETSEWKTRHATRFETTKIEYTQKLNAINKEIKNLLNSKVSLQTLYLLILTSDNPLIQNHPKINQFNEVMIKYGESNKSKKQENEIYSNFRDLIELGANEYYKNLKSERIEYLGGVKVISLNSKELGKISSKDKEIRKLNRKLYGWGAIDPKRVSKINTFIGMNLLPLWKKNYKKNNYNLEEKGFIDINKYIDPNNTTFIVHSEGGPKKFNNNS